MPWSFQIEQLALGKKQHWNTPRPSKKRFAVASIFVILGPNKGDYYPLGRRTNVLGRDEAVPIQILDKRVSRKHMQIRFEEGDGQYYALDMKSTHGVFINGRRIFEEISLANGDEIRIGDTVLLFVLEDFPNRESALTHFKKVGQRRQSTSG